MKKLTVGMLAAPLCVCIRDSTAQAGDTRRDRVGARKKSGFSFTDSKVNNRQPAPLLQTEVNRCQPWATPGAAEIGNKAANLKRLQRLLGDAASVPAFIVVSHADMRAHLQQHVPDLDARWRSLSQAIQAAGNIDAGQQEQLKHLRHAIETACATHPLELDVAFLAAHAQQRCMVRSTGREDSHQFSNAGGNESIANVPTHAAILSEAAGRVVSSYIGPKSLRQRLLAQDRIDKPLFSPVLIQVMEGEQASDAAVVAAGVMFTAEAAGQTPGVVHVELAFGHNEGVVNGEVATDAAYTYQGQRHEVICIKPTRLRPGEDNMLTEVFNAVPLQRRSPLTARVHARLVQVGQRIHAEYGEPMDIEWVYNPNTDLLSIVQARTLNFETLQPSYLDMRALRRAPQQPGALIGSGAGSVTYLSEQKHLLCAETLAAALRTYLDAPERQAIKMVAVRRMAPATSHEATFLRGRGVPILQVEMPQLLQRWLRSPAGFGIDTQTGLCVQASAKAVAAATKPGWRHHPIAAQLSLPKHAGLQAPELVAFLQSLAAQAFNAPLAGSDAAALLRQLFVAAAPHRYAVLAAAPRAGNRFVRLLDAVETHREPRLWAQTLAVLLREVVLAANHIAQNETTLRPLAEQLTQQFCQDAAAVFAARRNDAPQIAQRYTQRWLRTVLTQPADRNVVQSHSLLTLMRQRHALQRARQQLKSPGATPPLRDVGLHYWVEYEKLKPLAWQPELATAWNQLIDYVVRQGEVELNQQLARMVHDLHALDATALWLNACFAPVWVSCAVAVGSREQACLQTLHADFVDPSTQSLLAWAKNLDLSIQRWQRLVSQWAEPSKFDSMLASLEDEITQTTARWAELYPTASKLGKLLGLRSLQAYTEIVDQSIKSLSGTPTSTDLQELEKAQRFSHMVAPYQYLAEKVGTVLFGNSELADLGRFDTIKTLQAEQRRWFTGVTLQASRNFVVNAALVTSPGDFQRYAPYTMEDFFTLAHQNIRVAVNFALMQNGIDRHLLPHAIQDLCAQVEAARLTDGTKIANLQTHPSLIGIEDTYPIVAAHYNLPMRSHAGTLTVAARRDQASVVQAIEVRANLFSEHLEALGLTARTMRLIYGERIDVDCQHSRELCITWRLSAAQLSAFQRELTGVLEVICFSMFQSGTAEANVGLRFPEVLKRRRPLNSLWRGVAKALPREKDSGAGRMVFERLAHASNAGDIADILLSCDLVNSSHADRDEVKQAAIDELTRLYEPLRLALGDDIFSWSHQRRLIDLVFDCVAPQVGMRRATLLAELGICAWDAVYFIVLNKPNNLLEALMPTHRAALVKFCQNQLSHDLRFNVPQKSCRQLLHLAWQLGADVGRTADAQFVARMRAKEVRLSLPEADHLASVLSRQGETQATAAAIVLNELIKKSQLVSQKVNQFIDAKITYVNISDANCQFNLAVRWWETHPQLHTAAIQNILVNLYMDIAARGWSINWPQIFKNIKCLSPTRLQRQKLRSLLRKQLESYVPDDDETIQALVECGVTPQDFTYAMVIFLASQSAIEKMKQGGFTDAWLRHFKQYASVAQQHDFASRWADLMVASPMHGYATEDFAEIKTPGCVDVSKLQRCVALLAQTAATEFLQFTDALDTLVALGATPSMLKPWIEAVQGRLPGASSDVAALFATLLAQDGQPVFNLSSEFINKLAMDLHSQGHWIMLPMVAKVAATMGYELEMRVAFIQSIVQQKDVQAAMRDVSATARARQLNVTVTDMVTAWRRRGHKPTSFAVTRT